MTASINQSDERVRQIILILVAVAVVVISYDDDAGDHCGGRSESNHDTATDKLVLLR